MIKECIVKLNNDVVTVVDYDGVDIQFPPIRKVVKTVFVSCKDGKYSIVEDKYKPNDATAIQKKSIKKKTTNKESSKEVEDTIEDDEYV